MTVTITGSVTVGGVPYPVRAEVELPDAPVPAVPRLQVVPARLAG